MQQTSPIYHAAVTSHLTSGFIKVVLGSLDGENFRCQKHRLNADKYFFKTFFVNHGSKLYVIVEKIQDRSTQSLNQIKCQTSYNIRT